MRNEFVMFHYFEKKIINFFADTTLFYEADVFVCIILLIQNEKKKRYLTQYTYENNFVFQFELRPYSTEYLFCYFFINIV